MTVEDYEFQQKHNGTKALRLGFLIVLIVSSLIGFGHLIEMPSFRGGVWSETWVGLVIRFTVVFSAWMLVMTSWIVSRMQRSMGN
jgi:hypothetical protein